MSSSRESVGVDVVGGFDMIRKSDAGRERERERERAREGKNDGWASFAWAYKNVDVPLVKLHTQQRR
jgi:hypothetical protein